MYGTQLTTSLASVGVFTAMVAIGSHLSKHVLAGSFKYPPLTLVVPLSISLGLTAVTPVLLVAAMVGLYSAPVFGLVGWIATALIRFRVPARTIRSLRSPRTIILLVVSAAAGVVAFLSSGEHLYGGRDQGFYTNLAVWMAHHGKTVVDIPLGLTDPGLPHALGKGVSASGLYPGPGHFISQFSHAYPAWLAQAFSVAGFEGMDAFNAFLAASNILLFFAVARSLVRSGPALIAAAFFAFSPAQVWISRITLSELLAQQGVLTMALLSAWAIRRRSTRLLVAAGLAGSFVFLTRIGGMLVLPPLVLGVGTALLLRHRDISAARTTFVRLCMVVAGGFAIGTAYYWFDSGPYLDANKGAIAPMALVIVATSALALLFRQDRLVRIRPVLENRTVRIAVAVALSALFCWAYFVRPQFGLTFDGLGTRPAAEVMRPFKANTLWNLGAYLSPPVLFAGFAGLCVLLLSRRSPVRFASALPFVAVWLACSLFMLQDPHISADHPWTIRRFVPVILPGFVLLAFVLVDRIESILRRQSIVAAVRTVIVALLAAFVYRATPTDLLHREFDGSREFLAEVAANVPTDRPVFVHGSLLWALPLRMVFDRPVFRIDLNKKAGRRLATEIAEMFPDLKCAVVHNYSFPSVAPPVDHKEFTWKFKQITPTPYPLAHEWGQGSITIAVDLLDDATALIGVKSPKFGGQLVPGIKESGFWGPEFDGSTPFRWTHPVANIELPVEEGTKPRSLRIHYKGIHPKGSDIVVTVNGRKLFSKHVTEQSGSLVVEGLDKLGTTDHIDLSIESTPFRPVDFGTGGDDRELGIRITYIEIDDEQD